MATSEHLAGLALRPTAASSPVVEITVQHLRESPVR